jgi:hypothetical protein
VRIQERLEVIEHQHENVLGTARILDEEPPEPVLVVDGKTVAAVLEVDPRLRHAIRDERDELGTLQQWNVSLDAIPFR